MDDACGSPAAFGYLTVVESATHGFFGGLLTISSQGRPLEFRCSTPLAPTRAQEILYGPTLASFLLAEVIGPALVDGAEIGFPILLTDRLEILQLPAASELAVCYVEPIVEASQEAVAEPAAGEPDSAAQRAESSCFDQAFSGGNQSHADGVPAAAPTAEFDEPKFAQASDVPRAAEQEEASVVTVGRYRLTVRKEGSADAETLLHLLRPLAARIDLMEPFGRIRAALAEAQIEEAAAVEVACDGGGRQAA